MLEFPDNVNRIATEVKDRIPADMQNFMNGSLLRGSKAFHTGIHDPRNWFHIYDDFQLFIAADWSTTKNGTGGGTQAVSGASNGILVMTADVADDDDINMQAPNETFMLAANKPLWFETRIAVDVAALSAIFVGLVVTDTAIVPGWQDGVGFYKEDGSGDALLDFVSDKDNTPTTVADAHTLVNATMVNLAFGWDGTSLLVPFVNGVKGTVITTNLNDDEEMALSFAIQNDSGVARAMSIDYYSLWQLR